MFVLKLDLYMTKLTDAGHEKELIFFPIKFEDIPDKQIRETRSQVLYKPQM